MPGDTDVAGLWCTHRGGGILYLHSVMHVRLLILIPTGEFSEDSKSKCKTAHRSRWEDAGEKATEMMARCEGLDLDAKLARLEKRARSAKGVVKVQRGSAC